MLQEIRDNESLLKAGVFLAAALVFANLSVNRDEGVLWAVYDAAVSGMFSIYFVSRLKRYLSE